MAYFNGTLLASPIVRGSSGDTYGTHHSILGVGGFMEVNDLTERNNLPVDSVNGLNYDGISSGQRRLGMLVYVHSEDTVYQLKVDISSWSGLTSSGKITALGNNSNWVTYAGNEVTVTGEKIFKQFTQTTHGFVVGDVIGHDGTEFIKSSSINAITIEPLGVVSDVIDVNNFELTFSGYVDSSSITDVNSNSLTGATVYYLSSSLGKLTPTKITNTAQLNKTMLIALTSGTSVVVQYKGVDVSNLTWDIFTGYTASTQIKLNGTITGATNLGFFSGFTGIQTLPINNLADNSYDGNYQSVYNNYYRDSGGYVRIGIATDGIARRGYVEQTTNKSWIWNTYTVDGAPVGWIFIDGNINSSSVYDNMFTGSSVNYQTPAYTNATWSAGVSYNNTSNVVIDPVIGSTTTGDTYTGSGPFYKDTVEQKLRLRSIKSTTPETINIEYDGLFINVSGKSFNDLTSVNNVGTDTTYGIYSGISGNTIMLKSLASAGGTTLNQLSDGRIEIRSQSLSDVTGATEQIVKLVTQSGHSLSVGNAVGVENGIYTRAIADGTYTGETIGIVSEVLNSNEFKIVQEGYIKTLSGLDVSKIYYISTTSAGNLTTTKPTTVGHIIRPILAPITSTEAWVLSNMGSEILPPTVFTEDVTVSIASGKTFGKYQNLDVIPASGKTAVEVIKLAVFEALEPTLTLTSSANSVDFGLSAKTVNLSFSYTIKTLDANVSTTTLEWRRGNTGTWSGLTITTGSTTYTHNIDDSADRFNTDVLNYRYSVTDDGGGNGQITYNVTPTAYVTPTISPSYSAETKQSYESDFLREVGNIDTLVYGSINSNNPYVNITGYTIQRSVDSGAWGDVETVTGLTSTGETISNYLDSGATSNAGTIQYRIFVGDEYSTNISSTYTITLRYASYYGYSTSTSLSGGQIVALGNEALLSSRTRSVVLTAALTEYVYVSYPASYGDLTSATQNGSSSVLGAFDKLSNETVTNGYGGSTTNIVYISDNPGAFSGDIIEFT